MSLPISASIRFTRQSPVNPDVYKNDHFVEVTEDVLETIQSAERAEAAYDRRMYRYKAYYSLDCDNGIENAILMKPQTPEMLLEESSCGSSSTPQ